MSDTDITLEGYFERVDEYVCLDVESQNGVFNPVVVKWNIDTLNYELDESTAFWKVYPEVTVNVKNDGAKAAKISLVFLDEQQIFQFDEVSRIVDAASECIIRFDLSESITVNSQKLCEELISSRNCGEIALELGSSLRVDVTYDDD